MLLNYRKIYNFRFVHCIPFKSEASSPGPTSVTASGRRSFGDRAKPALPCDATQIDLAM